MSEGHTEERPIEGGAVAVETEPGAPTVAPPPRGQRASRRAVLWLSAILVLIVAGVALSPFWAPDVAPLLPWGVRPGTSAEDYAALAERLAAVEKRPVPPSGDVDAIKSLVGSLGHRVEQLETAGSAPRAEIEKGPAPPGTDVDAIKSAESALAHRVDQLEAKLDGNGQIEAAVAATKAGMQQLEQRLGTVEAQSASRTASEAAELRRSEQDLSRLGNITADLANRLPALEQKMQLQSSTERTDAALAIVLLQMHEAVEQGRPFPAAYGAFKALARDPDLLAQAQPLAEAAQNGVASRTILDRRLAELAGQVVTVTEPAPEYDWGAQALARLRGVVTIRRIGPAQTGPEAAVGAAQAALTRGNLPGAVAALDPLTGANAEAAQPWLRLARERLAVETALDHLQQLLEARLDAPRAAPAATPAEPSVKAKAPS